MDNRIRPEAVENGKRAGKEMGEFHKNIWRKIPVTAQEQIQQTNQAIGKNDPLNN